MKGINETKFICSIVVVLFVLIWNVHHVTNEGYIPEINLFLNLIS
ncbi:hypothetical protein VAE122_2020001 [Vibrio aestuarianus]|nr:hypothetical protein VAE122_2020001 [Vibrio aestuarianus]